MRGDRTQSIGVFEVEIPEKLPDVFANELWKCKNFVARFYLAPDARRVQLPHGPIPYGIEGPLEEEIERLLAADVLEPVEMSEWSTLIVTVKKANGRIRICADISTGLNAALVDDKYPLPNIVYSRNYTVIGFSVG